VSAPFVVKNPVIVSAAPAAIRGVGVVRIPVIGIIPPVVDAVAGGG
jgi:hypothetical protein